MVIDTLVSGRKRKTKIKENVIVAAMIERVPGVLSGEASSIGNNCTGMNAASHSAPEVNEIATPVDIMILVRVALKMDFFYIISEVGIKDGLSPKAI